MHWRNSNFQIKHFLANKCHTADEAYRILKQLFEERDVAIKSSAAETLRTKATVLKNKEILNKNDVSEIDKLEAEAKLVEIDAMSKQSNDIIQAAIKEREYIETLIVEINDFRKFKHLSDYDAFQASQEEEWMAELIFRTENFLASQGSIPHDHLATMRLHPLWEKEIFPKINNIQNKLVNDNIILMHKTPYDK